MKCSQSVQPRSMPDSSLDALYIHPSANLPAPDGNLNILVALCACDCELSVGFVPFEDLLEPILLPVSMPARAKHRLRYTRTYIFVIDSDPRASRSIHNTSLHTITCWARYISP
jgi:hypothetical protein